MKRKHVPTRLCVGCQARDARTSMSRFRLIGTSLQWGRQGGRGAYLHARQECRAAFVARKAPLRSLRASIDRTRRLRLLSAETKQ